MSENNNSKDIWKYVAVGVGVPVAAFLLYKLFWRKSNTLENSRSYDIRKVSYYKTKVYQVFENIRDTFDENGPIPNQIPELTNIILQNPEKWVPILLEFEGHIYIFKILGSYEPELRGTAPNEEDFQIINECIDFAKALSSTQEGLESLYKTNFILTDLYHSLLEYSLAPTKEAILEILTKVVSSPLGALAMGKCLEYFLFIRREKSCFQNFIRLFFDEFEKLNFTPSLALAVINLLTSLLDNQVNNTISFLDHMSESNILPGLSLYSQIKNDEVKQKTNDLLAKINKNSNNNNNIINDDSNKNYTKVDFNNEELRFQHLTQRWSRFSGCLWTVTPATFPNWMRKYTLEEQNAAVRKVRNLSRESKMASEVRVRDINREIAAICCGVEKGFFGGLLHTAGMFSATKEFIQKALSYDPELTDDDVHKAGRNFWTCVSLQLVILRVKIECQSALLGYSLLYPYTDDYLDDNEVSDEDKKKFNHKFRNWLAGVSNNSPDELPSSHLERKVHQMVKFIEDQWDRDTYPNVYYSLLSIQDAQVKSTLLHGGKATDEEIFELSVEKGGCSVLADAWLSGGNLTDYQSVFGFHFGVALQILDDLQDVRRDLRDNQDTLFTIALKRKQNDQFDRMAKRLIHFFNIIIHPDHNNIDVNDEEYKLRISMVTVCNAIVMKAITKDEKLFTPEFIKEIEWFGPLPASSMKKIVLVKRLMTLVRKDEI